MLSGALGPALRRALAPRFVLLLNLPPFVWERYRSAVYAFAHTIIVPNEFGAFALTIIAPNEFGAFALTIIAPNARLSKTV